MDNVWLVSDEAMDLHDPGPGHPESSIRLAAIRRVLHEEAPDGLSWRTAPPATREILERIHTPAYIDEILFHQGRSARLDHDTLLSRSSVPAAHLSAGCAVEAVRAVCKGDARRAFALVRPPGHHAEHDRAMGFCVFNNTAIAAQYAIDHCGIKRVMIIDWDVHHGNGTQHAFYDRDDVMVCSFHRFPFYPGTGSLSETGEGAGEGFNVNVPMPPGSTDEAYHAAFTKVLPALGKRFKPQLILVSAGFNRHHRDPMGGMALTEQGYASLTSVVRELARRYSRARLAMILEGGFHPDATARSVLSCVGVLAGARPRPPKAPDPKQWGLVSPMVEFHAQRA